MANGGTGATNSLTIDPKVQGLLESIGGGLMGQLNPVAAAGQALGGIAQVAGSLIGGGARRREQRRARQEMQQRKADYEALDTSNPYKNITNTFENLTVNTQAADFAA